MHMRTAAHTSKIKGFRGACAYVQACATAQLHTHLNRIRMHPNRGHVQFALFPLHNHFCLFFDHISLLLFQDCQSNISNHLRHDRIAQSFESIDAFRDSCCHPWDLRLYCESEMSVQPGG